MNRNINSWNLMPRNMKAQKQHTSLEFVLFHIYYASSKTRINLLTLGKKVYFQKYPLM